MLDDPPASMLFSTEMHAFNNIHRVRVHPRGDPRAPMLFWTEMHAFNNIEVEEGAGAAAMARHLVGPAGFEPATDGL